MEGVDTEGLVLIFVEEESVVDPFGLTGILPAGSRRSSTNMSDFNLTD